MTGPKVSVIIPVFNAEKYLHRCVESVISQTLRDIEIILVDDGTPDACGAICDEYASKDRRIRVIHEENRGAGGARNSGIRIAAAEYIGFVDSDDYIDAKLFERLYHAAAEVGADVCYGDLVWDNREINSNLAPYPTLYQGAAIQDILLPNLTVFHPGKRNKYYCRHSACAAIYKRSVIKDNQVLFHDDKKLLGEDAIFNIDFCHHASSIRILSESMYYVCPNPDSTTRSYRSDYFEARKLFHRLYMDRAKAMGFHDQASLQTDYLLLLLALDCILKGESFRDAIGLKAVLAYIRKIIIDPELVAVLRRYPLRSLPLEYMVFLTFMRMGFPWALYTLSRINTARKKLSRMRRLATNLQNQGLMLCGKGQKPHNSASF